jgi:hypothetical protein
VARVFEKKNAIKAIAGSLLKEDLSTCHKKRKRQTAIVGLFPTIGSFGLGEIREEDERESDGDCCVKKETK